MSTHWEEPEWAAEAREKRGYWESKMDELEEDISLLHSVIDVIPVDNDSSWTEDGVAPEYEKIMRALYNIRDILEKRLEKKSEEYNEAENWYNFYVDRLMCL